MTENNKATIRAAILIIILTFVSLFAKSQIRPYAGLEYYMGYNYLYKGKVTTIPLLMDVQVRNNKPSGLVGNTIMGLEYQLKNFRVDVRAETLTYHDGGLVFMPIQSNYFVSLRYDIGEFSIKYEHLCTHPTKYLDRIYFETFGGYDKIGIYWKLKNK